MKFLLLLAYLYKGDIVIEQIPQPSEAVCMESGRKKIAELTKDPRFEQGIIATCLQKPSNPT